MRRVDCSLQWLPQYCYNILPYTCNQVAFPLSYQSNIGLILIEQLDRVVAPFVTVRPRPNLPTCQPLSLHSHNF